VRKSLITLAAACAAILGAGRRAAAVSVGDVAEIKGRRLHRVFGVGLVTGLRGTGDKGLETQKRTAVLLRNLNLSVDPTDLPSKNVALVFVVARIKSDAPKGTLVDVTVASMGDATSLADGQLLPTPLHTDDPEQVYARAQGTVSVNPAGTLTSGTIVGGATVEQEIPSRALQREYVNARGQKVSYFDLVLSADKGSFALADEIAEAINTGMTGMRVAEEKAVARALGPNQIRVEIPPSYRNRRVAFARDVMNMPVVVDPPAQVVIDELSGVVVITGNVRISPVDIQVGPTRVFLKKEGSLQDLKKAANEMYQGGNTELIAIIKQLARAGALQARLVSR
jgi:flagellar P-ring protein precursor FlgI